MLVKPAVDYFKHLSGMYICSMIWESMQWFVEGVPWHPCTRGRHQMGYRLGG